MFNSVPTFTIYRIMRAYETYVDFGVAVTLFFQGWFVRSISSVCWKIITN